jgi:hypothetical protein
MATVEKLGGSWVIIRGNGMNRPDDVSDSLAPQDVDAPANREFWTGNGWAGQYGLARQFTTKEDAETYFTEHRHQMG